MQPMLLAAWAPDGCMVAHTCASSSHSPFCMWWLCPAPLRNWAVAEVVCPNAQHGYPSMLLSTGKTRTTHRKKQTKMDFNVESQLETLGQVFSSYELGLLEMFWLTEVLRSCPSVPIVSGKESVYFYSVNRLWAQTLTKKQTQHYINKETSH